MNEHDLERALRDWARADADVYQPDRLRERVMAVPESVAAHPRFRIPWLTGWWRAQPGTATVMVAAVLLLLTISLVPLFLLAPDEEDTETGATIVVALDGTGDFATIADAVAAASDGDTILVRPGTYVESILIDKDITLRGDGDRDEIVITSPSDRPDRLLPREQQPYAIRLDDTEANLENVSLTGPASALIVRGGSPQITNVAVIDVGVPIRGDVSGASLYAALALVDGSTAQVRFSLFRRSDVVVLDGSDVALGSNTFDGSMIQLGERSSGIGEDEPVQALITANTFDDAWIAIRVIEDAAAQIEGNRIIGAENVAAWIHEGGPRTAVLGNSIRDSKTAILVVNGPVDVAENELSGNEVGVNISGSGSSIRDNLIVEGTVGVLVTSVYGSSTSLTLERNKIEGNMRGIAISSGTSVFLTGNVVCDNQTNLAIVDGANPTFEDNRICQDAVSTQAP